MNAQLFTTLLLGTMTVFSLVVLRTIHRASGATRVVATIGVAFASWMVATILLLSQGLLNAGNYTIPLFGIVVVGPFIAGLVAYSRSDQLRSAISTMTTVDFLQIQLWRSPFGVFFFFTADLPLWFQLLGGIGDIAAGLGAAAALRYLQRNPQNETRGIIMGNTIGLADFALVLSSGMAFVVPDVSLDLGFNLIPLYAVPIFFLTHAASLALLLRGDNNVPVLSGTQP